MSRRLIVAPSAREDLVEIRRYLERTAGPQAAARVLTELRDAIFALAAGTAGGHRRADLAKSPVMFHLVFR